MIIAMRELDEAWESVHVICLRYLKEKGNAISANEPQMTVNIIEFDWTYSVRTGAH